MGRIRKNQKKVYGPILYAILYVCTMAFLLWKCRFGFGNIDESFYLTIPYRLCQGDGLLLHEWHLSQLSGFLLLPAMKAYLAVFGSTTGIILSFRILFTVAWGMAALFFTFVCGSFRSLQLSLQAFVF